MELGTALIADSSGKKIQTQHREHRDRSTEGRERKRQEKVGALPKVHRRKPVPAKEKRPDGGRGALFYGDSLPEQYLVCQEGNAKKKSRAARVARQGLYSSDEWRERSRAEARPLQSEEEAASLQSSLRQALNAVKG